MIIAKSLFRKQSFQCNGNFTHLIALPTLIQVRTLISKPLGAEGWWITLFILVVQLAAIDAQTIINLAIGSTVDSPIHQVWGNVLAADMGRAVAYAGDVNGDGLSDFLVGAPGGNHPTLASAGSVLLMFGRDNRTGIIVDTAQTDSSIAVEIFAPIAQVRMGNALSTAGDLNKDGVDDILVGSARYDRPGKLNCGGVMVVYGMKTGWDTAIDSATLATNSKGFWIWGAAVNDNAGASVSTVDFNNDGNPDIVIGSPYAVVSSATAVGILYILLGKGTATISADIELSAFTSSSINGVRVFGDSSAANYLFGVSASGAGDVNDDGIDDVVVGAAGASYSGRAACGAVWIIFGSTGALTDIYLNSILPTKGFAIYGASAGDQLGSAVSKAGDVNGDNVADIVIGGNSTTTSNGKTGAAYVILGRASGATPFTTIDLAAFTSGPEGFKISGAAANDLLGQAVAGGGDVNNDGYDDVVIGASTADPTSRNNGGRSYVIYGQDEAFFSDINLAGANFASTLGYRIDGAASNDQSGMSVALLPDFDGDGLSDIGIGAALVDPGNPSRFNAGNAYMLLSVENGSAKPTSQPSSSPSGSPTITPTSEPSARPSNQPTASPSTQPSAAPSGSPSSVPSSAPTARPSTDETVAPSSMPSADPSSAPSSEPSSCPSTAPTTQPSSVPSMQPSSEPSSVPTMMPSVICLPGNYLVPSTATAFACIPCPVGTHSETTNALKCNDCPYPYTTVDPGTEHCAAVNLDMRTAGTATVFGLLGMVVVCSVAANVGALSLIFLVVVALFTLDTLTDLAYILTAKFVSRAVFGCCIAFFLLPNIAIVGSILASNLVMSNELMHQAVILRAVLGAVPQIILQLYNQVEGDFSAVGIISVIASGLAIELCGVGAIVYFLSTPAAAPIYTAPSKIGGVAMTNTDDSPAVAGTYEALVGEEGVELQEQDQEQGQEEQV